MQKIYYLDPPLPGYPSEYGLPEFVTKAQAFDTLLFGPQPEYRDTADVKACACLRNNLAVIRSGNVHPINRAASTSSHEWHPYAAKEWVKKRRAAA